MKFTVRYQSLGKADCTSDPHIVHYGEGNRKKILEAMFDDINKVLDSDMIQNVEDVHGTIGSKEYESDQYMTSDLRDKDKDKTDSKYHKKASGPMAEKHKTSGLYFYEDADVPVNLHLPPGVTGAKEFMKIALMHPNKFTFMRINVVWAFAGDSSCSDDINIGSEDNGDINSVNYESQDWWISKPGYKDWCKKMGELLGKYFPSSDQGE